MAHPCDLSAAKTAESPEALEKRIQKATAILAVYAPRKKNAASMNRLTTLARNLFRKYKKSAAISSSAQMNDIE
ncbi:hypothetical protein D3C80_2107810 [compost metagenome]